jgi:hypothetical protein
VLDQPSPEATAHEPPSLTKNDADVRPPFPVDVFPEKVARFARRVAAAMGCALDFPGVAALVISGAAIGAARSLYVKGGWEEKPGMYAVIVSPPGTAKTPALKALMAPIYSEQDRLCQDHRAAAIKYKDDDRTYKRALKKDEEGGDPVPPEKPPPLRHLYANDTTVEALACNLDDNRKGLLVFRDELTAWVRAMDMYKGRGTDRQFFLSAWSGEPVKVDRKSQKDEPVNIPHPFIAVLGGIQPDLLPELESEGRREDGFIHRILFSYPRVAPVQGWVDADISEEDELEWQVVVGRLLALRPVTPEGGSERPRRLAFSPDGLEAFKAWCDRLAADMNAEDFPRELVGPCSKMKGYAARFALVIHLMRVACDEAGDAKTEGEVDAEDVKRAVMLCDYFRAHYKLVACRLQQSKEDKDVETLVAWLHKKGKDVCTARDVHRANLCGITKSSDAEKLLAAAVDRGFGDWQGPGTGTSRAAGKSNKWFGLKAKGGAGPTRPTSGADGS